jgi:hypothetical protein
VGRLLQQLPIYSTGQPITGEKALEGYLLPKCRLAVHQIQQVSALFLVQLVSQLLTGLLNFSAQFTALRFPEELPVQGFHIVVHGIASCSRQHIYHNSHRKAIRKRSVFNGLAAFT